MTEQYAPCPMYKKCGGCQMQNLPYERQLIHKQALVKRLCGRYGKVKPIIGMENPYHYRNKVQAAFGQDRRGKLISGVYQSGSHRIVPVDSCQLEDKIADEIIVYIRSQMPSFHMSAYNPYTKKGFLRHVLVKRGFSTNEIMVVLVTGNPVFPGKNAFIKNLLARFPNIKTIIQSINNGPTSLVLGKQEKVLYGKGYITDVLCGMRFRISAASFYQINPVQTEVLYNLAIKAAGLTPKTTLLDAYCGVGTIGLAASSHCGFVTGVELNPDAVRDAIANAKENNVINARFVCGDAGEFMEELAANGEQVDVVMMDPPRAGSSRKFIDSLCTLSPKRVVYVSCNPETLARDLNYLTQGGYQVQSITPVDMFPHTAHVECVVELKWNNTAI
ncbi:MAG: 23S rRNA (uracil(1939)-C(5))-methyltransferase RlmD [Clostridia bacterium]|nr:23S rRNA (uracil(1939)-C(5))-methyltransferase RlmD [Clostridia bacterium]